MDRIIGIDKDWQEILLKEFEKAYFQRLWEFIEEEYRSKTVYPEKHNIFKAFILTPFSKVKAVIVGQDPYHQCGQAHGLAFSVPKTCKIPPSLKNIFKELTYDLNIAAPYEGSLLKWANEGVLLLNTALTVREGQPASHRGKGWEIFTDNIISILSAQERPIVFILWGNYARSKKGLIDQSLHHIIESPHPSPLSANNGFFGSRPFSRTNAFLGKDAIDWNID